MTHRSNDEPLTIEGVTEAAEAAAARGEWDRVVEYYQQRESLLPENTLSPEVRSRILNMDRAIAGQARVAQAGLASLLDEAAKTRQRLHGLRQWNGATLTDSGTIERHI